MFILDTELTNHGATPATNVWHATELLVPPSAPDAQRVFAARLKSAFESNPKGVGARGAAHQVAAPGVATVQRHQLTYDGKIEGQLAMHIMGCITYRSAINSSSVHQTWYIAEIKALDGAMPTYTTGMTLPIKAEPYFTGSYIN